MKLEPKDRLYLLGAVAFLVKSLVQEPYEKAAIAWTPPAWLLSTVSLLTFVAVLVLGVVALWPRKEGR